VQGRASLSFCRSSYGSHGADSCLTRPHPLPALEKSSAGFSSSIQKEIMFWITALGFFMAAALVKLGVSLVMVSLLTAALWGAGACLTVLLLLVVWLAWRR
jgi:hypothetical protein